MVNVGGKGWLHISQGHDSCHMSFRGVAKFFPKHCLKIIFWDEEFPLLDFQSPRHPWGLGDFWGDFAHEKLEKPRLCEQYGLNDAARCGDLTC